MNDPFPIDRKIDTSTSKEWHERSVHVSPGGSARGDGQFYPPHPLFFRKALGSKFWDVDGNEYVDIQGGPGPHVLGHSHPEIIAALTETMQTVGVFFGSPHPSQVELAEVMCELIPCAELALFSGGGGSDPLYHAVRVAKHHTGRQKIVKLEGGFHGWHDWSMISVRPTLDQMGPDDHPTPVPETGGIAPSAVENTIIISANDEAMLERTLTERRNEVAAFVVEPVIHGFGAVPLTQGYLRLARQLTDEYGIVFIFDEMLTGFRHDLGGIQRRIGVTPDLAIFGKSWTNGSAVMSALVGTREIMSDFMPTGTVMFSGSYGANLMGVTAALKTIEILKRDNGAVFEKLYRLGDMVRDGINKAASDVGVPARCHNYGSIFIVYPFMNDVNNYRDRIYAADLGWQDKFTYAYCTWLMNHGIFLPPRGGGRGRSFVNAAHTEDEVEQIIDTAKGFFREYRAAIRAGSAVSRQDSVHAAVAVPGG